MSKNISIIKFIMRVYRQWRALSQSANSYTASYRIAKIEKDETDVYHVLIQLIGKSTILKIEPEKILADDKMVNCFSPADIRTLTFLGYLGINGPKYKILAKQLSEKNDQVLFALQKKGEKTYQVVTANEISVNADIIEGLSQKDAHMIGLTTANEQMLLERKQKENLLRELQKSDDI